MATIDPFSEQNYPPSSTTTSESIAEFVPRTRHSSSHSNPRRTSVSASRRNAKSYKYVSKAHPPASTIKIKRNVAKGNGLKGSDAEYRYLRIDPSDVSDSDLNDIHEVQVSTSSDSEVAHQVLASSQYQSSTSQDIRPKKPVKERGRTKYVSKITERQSRWQPGGSESSSSEYHIDSRMNQQELEKHADSSESVSSEQQRSQSRMRAHRSRTPKPSERHTRKDSAPRARKQETYVLKQTISDTASIATPPSSSHSSSASSSEVVDIRGSLKDHYDAIKSLQNVLLMTQDQTSREPSHPSIPEESLVDRSSDEIQKRLDSIETQLKTLGSGMGLPSPAIDAKKLADLDDIVLQVEKNTKAISGQKTDLDEMHHRMSRFEDLIFRITDTIQQMVDLPFLVDDDLLARLSDSQPFDNRMDALDDLLDAIGKQCVGSNGQTSQREPQGLDHNQLGENTNAQPSRMGTIDSPLGSNVSLSRNSQTSPSTQIQPLHRNDANAPNPNPRSSSNESSNQALPYDINQSSPDILRRTPNTGMSPHFHNPSAASSAALGRHGIRPLQRRSSESPDLGRTFPRHGISRVQSPLRNESSYDNGQGVLLPEDEEGISSLPPLPASQASLIPGDGISRSSLHQLPLNAQGYRSRRSSVPVVEGIRLQMLPENIKAEEQFGAFGPKSLNASKSILSARRKSRHSLATGLNNGDSRHLRSLSNGMDGYNKQSQGFYPNHFTDATSSRPMEQSGLEAPNGIPESSNILPSRFTRTSAYSDNQSESGSKRSGMGLSPPNLKMEELASQIQELKHDLRVQSQQFIHMLEKNEHLEKRMVNLDAINCSAHSPDLLQNQDTRKMIQQFCTKIFQKHQISNSKKIDGKVDTAVLEELAQHIATRDELKTYVRKSSLESYVKKRIRDLMIKNQKLYSDLKEMVLNQVLGVSDQQEQKIARIVRKELHTNGNAFTDDGKYYALENRLQINLQQWLHEEFKKNSEDQISHLESIKKDLIVNFKDFISDQIQRDLVVNCKELIYEQVSNDLHLSFKSLISEEVDLKLKEPVFMKNTKSMPPKAIEHDVDEYTNTLLNRLTRDFDEKLYMVCSDLSATKQLFTNQAQQPFYRCAQWIWNTGSLKLGSAVPWNLQTANTDPDNFKWDQDHFNIRITEAGLYEINLAFFTKAKPSIQLVINGDSVLSAINSPSYVVHHSSGFVMDGVGKVEPGTDFMALPSKSTLSVHYHGVKKNSYAHGFLALKRL